MATSEEENLDAYEDAVRKMSTKEDAVSLEDACSLLLIKTTKELYVATNQIETLKKENETLKNALMLLEALFGHKVIGGGTFGNVVVSMVKEMTKGKEEEEIN